MCEIVASVEQMKWCVTKGEDNHTELNCTQGRTKTSTQQQTYVIELTEKYFFIFVFFVT